MLHGDVRGWRVALVADAVANPEPPAGPDDPGSLDVMGALVAADWGAIVPPPHDFALTTIGQTIERIVDDLADYARNGYRVVCIGSGSLSGQGWWSDLVGPDLAARGLELERFDVDGATADELVAFLAPGPVPR